MIRNLNKIVTIKFIHIKQFQLKKSSSRIYILAPISARKENEHWKQEDINFLSYN